MNEILSRYCPRIEFDSYEDFYENYRCNAPLPHFACGRFLKALEALFASDIAAPAASSRALSFRLYVDEASLGRALAGGGADLTEGIAKVSRWRPFLELPPAPVFIPILPFPFPGAPVTLAFDKAMESSFPPSDTVSPTALAAAARCVWDLIAAAAARSVSHFPKLDKVLSHSNIWKRRGIYLTFSENYTPASGADETYPAVFRRFLEGGFLLPPSPADPSILPGELSPGEEAKLAALLREAEE
ncbi:hypothetical protein FACS1894161_4260 [Spirochaetia bacterium]|nr:hypothetical protein FACS1894161_4260 [Spirochaetia bacterium]